MTPAAYPRVALGSGLRRCRGSAFVAATAVKRLPRERGLDEPGRLSPPIWPCTTRGFPCLGCCHPSGGLLPHLFTLTKRTSCAKTSRRFTCGMPPCRSAGGIFSVALSVSESAAPAEADAIQIAPLALPGALPIFPDDSGRCPDFPPVSHLAMARPAITRPARRSHYSFWLVELAGNTCPMIGHRNRGAVG